MLTFSGRGSAFADEQNSAYLVCDDTLILLDCPMSAFHRLRRASLMRQIRRIEIYVTHTHSDHTGGIPMMIHFAFYVLHIPVCVVAPSAEVAVGLQYLIRQLDGCEDAAYSLRTADHFHGRVQASPVETVHVPQLPGRCFGWHLQTDRADIVYTGDTATLDPFLPLLHSGTYFYTEAAVTDSGVHLYIDRILPDLQRLDAAGVHVYLMHLDDENAIAKKIRNTGIQLAPLMP